MAPFRVIIVGGSISGLALANMLDQYGIDFVLLEKHAVIAPQLGAGFAIQPNGARILHQLGCYQPIEDANEPVNSLYMSDEFGNPPRDQDDFGTWFGESFGYKMRFMDRRKVIDTLYENLRDKSKVHTSHEVVKVFSHSDGVEVELADGSVFHGDLLVGTDGVHSRIRQEMQRIAAEDTPGKDLFPETGAFTCEYSGIFGIANAPDGIAPDQGFKCFRKGRNILGAPGPGGTLYWILMFKNEKKTQGKAIPRYTDEDLDRYAATARDDIVKPGLTFGDIYDRRIRASLVPIEEGILEHCFYKRIVLLGDSWHKTNPIAGLGGNTAMQSAAVLANELKAATLQEGNADEARLETALQNYQRARQSLSGSVVDLSHTVQKMEALETPLAKFLQLKIIKNASTEVMMTAVSKTIAPAPRLNYLTLPSPRSLLPFADEVKVKSKPRSSMISILFALLLASLVFLLYPKIQQGKGFSTPEEQSFINRTMKLDHARSVQLYYNLSITVVTGIISVESYRLCFAMGPVSSALPFGIAAIFAGWELVAPVYFALFVYLTGVKSYYYPSPRAIDLATAQALRIAYLVNYTPIIAYTFACSTFPSFLWALSHATLPLTIRLIAKWIARRSTTSLCGPAFRWGNRDLKSIRNLFSIMQIILLVAFALGDRWHMSRGKTFGPFPVLFSGSYSYAADEVKASLLDMSLMAFMTINVWDLRRVKIHDQKVRSLMFHYIPLTLGLGFGPSAAAAYLWASREKEWEASRQRQEDRTDEKI